MDPATDDRTSASMLTYATRQPRLRMKMHAVSVCLVMTQTCQQWQIHLAHMTGHVVPCGRDGQPVGAEHGNWSMKMMDAALTGDADGA